MRTIARLLAVLVLLFGLSTTGAAAPAGNPLEMTDGFYADPASNPAKWVRANAGDPRADAIRTEIAEKPGARWFGDWNPDVAADVGGYVGAADAADELPLLVAYNIPGRDCGGHSGGGAGSPEAYRAWISDFAAAIGDRPAVVVIEPDALAQLDCMPEDERPVRLDLLSYAAAQFAEKAPNTWAYMDGGNATWVEPPVMAERLRAIGVERIRGFALNVSNYYTTEESVAKGDAIRQALGGSALFLVDTSRNGNGAAPGGEWCNPAGRGLGVPSQVGGGADLLVWAKVPGDSDGDCGIGQGVPAGTFSPDLAMSLING
ncbi:glycoside hydrolase family 6 protein [Saccharopolyspora erythraea]|uniref:glycoside hydrolase family 6 protein n=1 Tax=Saccharopolyspora erythraea TaxID=1836 RepID=UPI002012BBAE|nr:glycoside hydrolase family 6 protein [Saccharopolyspora erythraea]